MKDEILFDEPRYRESAVVNLDNSIRGRDTHWIAYKKRGKTGTYFDSFGDLRPSQELINYFDTNVVKHNHKRYQNFDCYNCGHLCSYLIILKYGLKIFIERNEY